jgi:hypothetical protein
MNHSVRPRMRANSSQGEKACRHPVQAGSRQAQSRCLAGAIPHPASTIQLRLKQTHIDSPAAGSRCPIDAAPPLPTGFLQGKTCCTGGSQRCTPHSTEAASRCRGSAGRPPPAAACWRCQTGMACPQSATRWAAVPCLQAAVGGSMDSVQGCICCAELICPLKAMQQSIAAHSLHSLTAPTPQQVAAGAPPHGWSHHWGAVCSGTREAGSSICLDRQPTLPNG